MLCLRVLSCLAVLLHTTGHRSPTRIVESEASDLVIESEFTPLCPGLFQGTPRSDHDNDLPSEGTFENQLKHLKKHDHLDDAIEDMKALLKSSNDCFPSDWGNYGPFMIRLAWHCSGSFRHGKGGCTGGRQRFEPERSWGDNANLDKARGLLYAIKNKHSLSWGDTFILAGTTALRESGAKVSKMCFGRIDEPDGTNSIPLNVTDDLIYVEPAGPHGVPDPFGSVADIRRTFADMGHSDRATVALIGGGHALGKCHGACPVPQAAGVPPILAFRSRTSPWRGKCPPTGVGADTSTSGFEGAWTTEPLKWDNEFFKYLINKEWEVHTGPGGKPQWRIKDENDPSFSKIIRLTSDIALLEDHEYKKIVKEFALKMDKFDEAFDDAWFKLTTNGDGKWSAASWCDDGSKPELATMRPDDSSMTSRRFAKH